eukprot:725437-Prymnesium_polylepis.1
MLPTTPRPLWPLTSSHSLRFASHRPPLSAAPDSALFSLFAASVCNSRSEWACSRCHLELRRCSHAKPMSPVSSRQSRQRSMRASLLARPPLPSR